MRIIKLSLAALAAVSVLLVAGCSDGDSNGGGGSGGSGGTGGAGGTPAEVYAANSCVQDKQEAAGAFCRSTFEAWAAWDVDQDDGARDSAPTRRAPR